MKTSCDQLANFPYLATIQDQGGYCMNHTEKEEVDGFHPTSDDVSIHSDEENEKHSAWNVSMYENHRSKIST